MPLIPSEATKAQLATLHALFSHGARAGARRQQPHASADDRRAGHTSTPWDAPSGSAHSDSGGSSLDLQRISRSGLDIVAILIDLVM